MSVNYAPRVLRRYSDLPSLIHILQSRSVTLLDPRNWEDKNDIFFLSQYKERKSLRTLLALCFSQVPETYHHWHVFSRGPAGVCIVFDREALLAHLDGQSGTTFGDIEYLSLNEAHNKKFNLDRLPFLKRSAFRPEGEFRVIHESSLDELSGINIPIDLRSIRRISLSPWLNEALSKSTIKSLRAIDGCGKLKVYRSTLISNERWKNLGMN